MIRMFVRHRVTDFDSWKEGYVAFDAQRRAMGVRGDAVFRGAGDPEDVTIWHDFDDLAAGQSFLGSSELAAAMKNAGAVGEPHVWFVDREMP